VRLDPGTAPDRKTWSTFLALSFLAAAPVAWFFPALLFGRFLYGMDVITLGFPAHAEALRSLAAHQWPLWAPDIMGGMPGIAASNLMFLAPSDLVASLAGWTARTEFAVDAVLWVALSGIGMFLFLRRLDRGISASLLGALFFCASGSQISQISGGYYNFVEGIALVPWAFWAAHKACKEASWFAWGLCGLVFALQILAEAAQIFAYTLPAVAAFSLALAGPAPGALSAGRGPSHRISLWTVCKGLAVALVLAALLSAPQLWLTLQYLPLSDRQGYTYAEAVNGSIEPYMGLAWLVPWRDRAFYGGVQGDFTCTTPYFGLLPWALASAALASLWRREACVRWMGALALTAFLVALRQWTPLQWLLFHLPLYKGFRLWSRILFLVTLAGCTLAAFGWDALRAPAHRAAALRGTLVFSVLALLVAACTWALAKDGAVAAAPRTFGAWAKSLCIGDRAAILAALTMDSARTALVLIPAALAVLWTAASPRASVRPWSLVLALAFHGVDERQVFVRYVRFMDPRVVVGPARFSAPPPPPPGPEPWRIYMYDASLPNDAMVHGYENMCGLASMPLRSYMRIADAMGGRERDWFNLFSVRYLFVHSRSGSAVPGDTVEVYQNRGAFPRAWLVTRTRTVAGDQQAWRLLSDPGFNPREEVALDGDPGLGRTPPKGRVVWLSRDPQTSALDVSTDRDAILVLSNNWYPSWRARVDGVETPVLKADGGLQAVLVRAGRHEVDFRFDQSFFYDALAACLAGLAALFGLARYEAQRRLR
jgi:hypothetical protein